MMTLSMFIHASMGWEGAALKYMNADKTKQNKTKPEEKHKAKRQVKKRK